MGLLSMMSWRMLRLGEEKSRLLVLDKEGETGFDVVGLRDRVEHAVFGEWWLNEEKGR